MHLIVVKFDNIIHVINLIEGHIHSEDAMWLFVGIYGLIYHCPDYDLCSLY